MTFNFTGEYEGNRGENVVPRAVVVIGGTPTIPLSYSLTMNDFFESDSLEITLPSDLIDLTLIYKEFYRNGTVVPIELWSGFVPSNSSQHLWTENLENNKPNDRLKHDLIENYTDVLTKRWVGIIKQFELNYNAPSSTDITNISCEEITSVLRRYTFEYKFDGDNATVESVISVLNSVLTDFYIDISSGVEERIKKYNMGTVTKYQKDTDDATVEEKNYVTVGKTLWDILDDIIKATGLTLILDENQTTAQQGVNPKTGKNKIKYLLKNNRTSDTVWLLERERHFTKCTLRNGRIGSGSPANMAIRLKSVQDKVDAKSKNSVNEGTFPKHLNTNVGKKSTQRGKNINPEGFIYFEKTVEPNLTKEILEARAYDLAQNYSKTALNGDLTVPNAITNIKPNHLIIISDNSSLVDYMKITSIVGDINKTDKNNTGETQESLNFRINSVRENYVLGQTLNQDIEFELDLNINTIDLETGQLKGLNLFPDSTKDDYTDIQQYETPKIEALPTFFQKMLMQGFN